MSRIVTFLAVLALVLAPATAQAVDSNKFTTTVWTTITGPEAHGVWSNDQVFGGGTFPLGGTAFDTGSQNDYICPPGGPCATVCGLLPSKQCITFDQTGAASAAERPPWLQISGALTCARSDCIAGTASPTCSFDPRMISYGAQAVDNQCDDGTGGPFMCAGPPFGWSGPGTVGSLCAPGVAGNTGCDGAGGTSYCLTGPGAGAGGANCTAVGTCDPVPAGSTCTSAVVGATPCCTGIDTGDGTPGSICAGTGTFGLPMPCCTAIGTGLCPPGNGVCTDTSGDCSDAFSTAGSCPVTGGAVGCLGAPCAGLPTSGTNAGCDDTAGPGGEGLCLDLGANGLFSECNTLSVPTAAAPPGPGTSTPGFEVTGMWCDSATFATAPDEPHGTRGSYSFLIISVPALTVNPAGTPPGTGSNGTGEGFFEGTFVTTNTRWMKGTNTALGGPSFFNGLCAAPGVPYACCTGGGTGTCSADRNAQSLIDVVSATLDITDATKTSGHSRVELAEIVPGAVLAGLTDTDPSELVTSPKLFPQTLVSGGVVHNACGEFSTVTDLTTKLQAACDSTAEVGDAFIIPKQALTGTIYPTSGVGALATTVGVCPGESGPIVAGLNRGRCPNIGDATETSIGAGVQAPGVDHCFVQNQLLPAAKVNAGAATVTAIQRSNALSILPPNAGVLADSTVKTSLSLYTTDAVDFDADGAVDCADNCLNIINGPAVIGGGPTDQTDDGIPIGIADNGIGNVCDGTNLSNAGSVLELGFNFSAVGADFLPVILMQLDTVKDVGLQ